MTTTSKLSETQVLVLTAAARHPERRVLPLPEHLKGGGAVKVIDALLAKGLIAEVEAKPGEPVWRAGGTDESAPPLALVATTAAFGALGIDEPQTMPGSAPVARTPREGTKQALLIAMLRAAGGATVPELAEATGWQPHTVRGAMTGALKKKLGLEVSSEKVEGRGRVYRLPAA